MQKKFGEVYHFGTFFALELPLALLKEDFRVKELVESSFLLHRYCAVSCAGNIPNFKSMTSVRAPHALSESIFQKKECLLLGWHPWCYVRANV